MTTLNQKDMILLLRLSQDSRISLTALGKELKLTPAAVAYRINKLVENKIIEKFTITINSSMLTPNYQSFLVQVKVKSNQLDKFVAELQEMNVFDHILSVTANKNIVGITIPISHKMLGNLNQYLSNSDFDDFTVIPILTKYSSDFQKDITVENVSEIYCLHCQKSLGGDAVLSTISDQTMAFCCLDCKEDFEKEYYKLLDINN